MISVTHPVTDEDFAALDALSSHVFLSHMPGESMAKRYLGLMGKENRAHINLIKENALPVSNVNWYPSTLAVGDARITVGQVGGVCTHPSARGKGYAEALLQHSFAQMKEEGVSFCVISGDRGLYIRNGARHFTKEYPFLWETPLHDKTVCHLPPDRLTEGTVTVFSLHEKESVRIMRSFLRVREELLSFGAPHHGFRGHLFMTESAYAVVSVTNDHAVLTEVCGEEAEILRIFGEAVSFLGMPLTGRLTRLEKERLPSLSFSSSKTPEMTAKLIDPSLLIRQLSPLFSAAGLGSVTLSPENGAYTAIINGESFSLTEEELFTAIFFGDPRFGAAFPLALPSFHSMDYQ